MDSPSGVDSITENTGAKRRNLTRRISNNLWSNGGAVRNGGCNGEDNGGEECDWEAWETLSKSFREAQSVLDQNRALIQQVNENHQSKNRDNMVKNVALIQEINGNISKVSLLYSNLSANLVNYVHQRRGSPSIKSSSNSNSNSSSNDKVESNSS